MNSLEKSFYDICAAHNLIALSINLHPANSAGFTCYAHAQIDDQGEKRLCASASNESLEAAITDAIAGIYAKRGLIEPKLADVALTTPSAPQSSDAVEQPASRSPSPEKTPGVEAAGGGGLRSTTGE